MHLYYLKLNGNGTSVAARASFFSGKTEVPVTTSTTTTTTLTKSVPVRPAPAIPLPPTSSSAPIAAPASSAVVSPPLLGHTEIVITKTVTGPASADHVSRVHERSPQKRPLSSPSFTVKAIFNKGDPAVTSPPCSATATPTATPSVASSTLQKMASLFKGNPQSAVLHVAEPPEPVCDDLAADTATTGPRSVKAAKINRESLRTLEISNPIPLKSIDLPQKVIPVRPAPAVPPKSAGAASTLPRSLPSNRVAGKVYFAMPVDSIVEEDPIKSPSTVERAESMRMRGVTSRPSIPQFGSMRAKRPLSVPFARPTSPPPNPPCSSTTPRDFVYDDCSKVIVEEGNIYASIEELHKEEPLVAPHTRDDGLLSEIVSELIKKKSIDHESVHSIAPSSAAISTTASSSVASSTTPSTKTASATIPVPSSIPSLEIASSKMLSSTPASSNTALSNPSATSNNVLSKSSFGPSTPSSTLASTSSTTPSSFQGYKPYSSSIAARNRYLGGTTQLPNTSASTKTTSETVALPATTATMLKNSSALVKSSAPRTAEITNTTTSTAALSKSRSNNVPSTAGTTLKIALANSVTANSAIPSRSNSTETTLTCVGPLSKPTTSVSMTLKKPLATSTSTAAATTAVPVALPSQPPVGRIAPTVTTAAINKPISVSSLTPGASSKLKSQAASKAVATNSAAPKLAAAAANLKPNTFKAAPKSTALAKATTQTGSTPSSLANSTLKTNSTSSSHVQIMQQKFDDASKTATGKNAPANKNSKINPKR